MLAFLSSIALLVFLFVQRLVDSPFGRVLRAVREDEVAAAALGKNTARYKLASFLIGASLASLAGSLYVHHIRVFSPTTFNITLTFTMLIMVILGGMGSNLGAVVGTVTIALINELPKKFSYPVWLDPGALHLLLYSVLMIAIMLYRPRGLLGEQEAGK